ncbi:MAG: ABC transporter ATP-binding protein [Candidatus Riflebacteria bacterium GWC2_50_8]|nr:MAG: ABC transporter ATP-binding protein [Candidatus Riflebacteria bacterium GWC2_50_8]
MILEIREVGKVFGGFCALQNVSIRVEEGKIHAIIGPNGAGKTTLFNLISGMFDISHGEIHYRDKRLNGLRPDIRAELGIGRTFQIVRLFPSMTVLENVMVGRHCRTHSGLLKTFFHFPLGESSEEKQIRNNAMQWLEFVGMTHRAQQVAANLPHPEQRRVEIARALALDPDLLLLDEPAAGMNPKETMDLDALIVKINGMGKTILLIEHNMNLVMGISEIISVLNFGEKIVEGTPAEVKENPAVIEAYLGKKRN